MAQPLLLFRGSMCALLRLHTTKKLYKLNDTQILSAYSYSGLCAVAAVVVAVVVVRMYVKYKVNASGSCSNEHIFNDNLKKKKLQNH